MTNLEKEILIKLGMYKYDHLNQDQALNDIMQLFTQQQEELLEKNESFLNTTNGHTYQDFTKKEKGK